MKNIFLILISILVFMLVSCGKESGVFDNTKVSEESIKNKANNANDTGNGQKINNKEIKIAFSFGTLQEERWDNERKAMAERAQNTPSVKFVYTDANHDANLQNSQIENLITQGINVLIIAPQDVNSAKIGCAAAKKAGIPVISYVRIVKSEDVDMFIGYDFEEIGKINAEAALRLVPRGNYVFMNGHIADSVPFLENQGYKKILQPYIERGDIKVLFDQYIPDWSPDAAMKSMDNILSKYKDEVDLVLSNNDGMAGGVCQSLTAQGRDGKVYVLGMDGDLEACQRIVEGKQKSSILIGQKPLADVGFDAALELAKGEKPKAINAVVDNEFGKMPAIYLKPIVITKENMYETIIKSGIRKVEDVYKNVSKSQWPVDN